MSEPAVHEGACLCGAVRYRASGAPLWSAHCHCESCRRATGGAVATWAGFPEDRFAFTAGAPVRFASSPGVVRTFCGRCGSALTYQSRRWPGEVHVTVGTLDRPQALPPERHVCTAERIAWLELADALPRYPRFGPDDDESAS